MPVVTDSSVPRVLFSSWMTQVRENMSDDGKMRINRYLSHYGVCSRREADRWIEEGRVRIGDRKAVPGDRVGTDDIVYVDDSPVKAEHIPVLMAYHKPCGVICTTSGKEHPNLIDVIDYPDRLFPIGRLDKDSSGLLLLTNDGELADELMRGRNAHEKEYLVSTGKPLSDEVVRAMEQGVPILDTMTRPCRIYDREGKSFHIILTQGLNRQIRRMCEYFGYRVTALHRIRFVTVTLDGLEKGHWRLLSEEEVSNLRKVAGKDKDGSNG